MIDIRVSALRPPLKGERAVTMHPVKSSFIESIGHEPDGSRIHVHFVDGGRYDFPGTAQELQAWRTSIDGGHSAGRFFHAHIKGREFNRRPKKAA